MNKVTIGIPTLNRAGYLKLALASALQQTYPELEVVVSNNASSDDTATFLASCADPRVKVLSQETTLSMVGNWNACLHAATGDYFLLLSDDDVLEPEAIARMVAAFLEAAQPERVGMVYCGGRVIDAEGRQVREGQQGPPEERAADLVRALLDGERDTWPCSILLRRSDMMPGYSADFLLITDAAMWVQAVARHGVAMFVEGPLVNYRVHQNLTSKTPVEVWHRDNKKFVEYALTCLQKAGESNAKLEREIRRALARVNTRLAVWMPLNAPNRKLGDVLREYAKQLPQLASGYGAFHLVKALLTMSASKILKRGDPASRAGV